MYQIDLNSDIGESFGVYRVGNDDALLRLITSANVACGCHAGDPMVMDRVICLAKELGVAVGAHPGYPDLQGFGRRKMSLSPDEVQHYVTYQLGALEAFARSHGVHLQHIKPHGALSNLCQHDRNTSRAICRAVHAFDPSLLVFACAGSALGEEAAAMGLSVVWEIYADRAYLDDLSLVPRSQPGAMITDEDLAAARCIRMVKEGLVTTITGRDVPIQGDTLCVHGDSQKALAFAEHIHAAFSREGITVRRIR
jgi:UPF0271 protein